MNGWTPGRRYEVDGVQFYVDNGRKGSHGEPDLVLRHADGRPVSMALAFFLVDFFSMDEDRRYPPPAKGWRKFFAALHTARKHGWYWAQAELDAERANLFGGGW